MRAPRDFFCMCKCICRYMILYMCISIMCIHRFYNSYSLIWKCCALFWFSVEMYNCRHWKSYCKKYISLSLQRCDDRLYIDFSVTSLKISIIFDFWYFCKKVEQCISIIKEKSFVIGPSGCVCRRICTMGIYRRLQDGEELHQCWGSRMYAV